MYLGLLFLCYSSLLVDASKRKLDIVSILEGPSQKIQRLSHEDTVVVQESSLFILADLIPLFLLFSDHLLAHSLSQVNHACFKAVCTSSFEVVKQMSCVLVGPKAWELVEQPGKIILNFAFQHLLNTKDIISRPEKLSSLARILIGLDKKVISMSVSEILKIMNMEKFEMNIFSELLTIVHRHREKIGSPTPYLTIYPKLLIGGFESFSQQINIEIVRMLRYRDNTEIPANAKNTEIYHKFFQDMFLLFPEFCAPKYQELHDTEAICPLNSECETNFTGIYRDILGPHFGLVVPALASEPIGIRLKVNSFDYLWKLILNKLTFLPRIYRLQVSAHNDFLDPEILREIGDLFKLVGALATSDTFSLEGLSDVKIFHLMNYISHSLEIDLSPSYARSIASKVVNAKDIVTPFHLKSVLHMACSTHFVYELMEKKISALPLDECIFEPLKFIGPSTIIGFINYHKAKKLSHSLWSFIRSNFHRIALGDKEMAYKYDAVLSFMAKSFPDQVDAITSIVVSAALSDKFLTEEKNLFFIFDQIPGMTASLRKSYDFRIKN